MDRMNAMRAFVEAVKRRGFGAAAEHLGISRTVVSRHIQSIETELGIRLMNRTTRSLSLTCAGQRYFDFCDDLLTRVEDMERQMTSQAAEARGEVAVLAPRWMQTTATRMLTSFAKANREIRPKLILGGMAQTAYGFLEQGCDVALHTRRIPTAGSRRARSPTSPTACARRPSISPMRRRFRTRTTCYAMLLCFSTITTRGSSNEMAMRSAFSRSRCFRPTPFPRFATPRSTASDWRCYRCRWCARTSRRGGCMSRCPTGAPSGQTLYVAIAPGSDVPVKVRLLLDFASAWFADSGL